VIICEKLTTDVLSNPVMVFSNKIFPGTFAWFIFLEQGGACLVLSHKGLG
jgi:hypothetical protein